MYKYRINELLADLPMKDYRRAIKIIPRVLEVSPNTFANYRSIRADEERDIPHKKVALLEKIFNIQPGSLECYEQHCKPIRQLLNEYIDN